MVGMDSGTPPVLFVVGTAGAGKSSLVTSFQRWSRFLETDAIAVNLDPGAERVHYDAEFDVRDLISLTEVMAEYDLGPNGAQILAALGLKKLKLLSRDHRKVVGLEGYGLEIVERVLLPKE